MLLALNIGNSNITFGGYAPDGKLLFSAKLYADIAASSDELTYKIINMLDLYGMSPLDIEDVILSSVVPALTPRLREALAKMTQAPVLTVGPGLKSGVRIRLDNTAQLPQVEIEAAPKALLGANTSDCLHSGIVNGTAAMLDGMIARFRRAMDAPEAPVIATGTLPASIRDACGCSIAYRETLILDGLCAIWQRNAHRPRG